MAFETEDEKQERLIKYYVIKGVSIISLIFRETKQYVFNFFHPMSRVEPGILKEAEKLNGELELFYGDIKLFKLSDNSQLIFYEGNKIRLMTILKPDTINPKTEEFIGRILEKFLYEFEFKNDKVLKTWNGDLSVFKDAEKLLFEYLNVDYTFPHISQYKGFDPDEPLAGYIYQAADIFTRKIGYFYLDNLLYLTKEYVRDKAREDGKSVESIQFPSDEEFYMAIFKLKKIGMLKTIDNFKEELHLFSKVKY